MAYFKIHNRGGWRHDEATAAGTITPGMLLEVTYEGKVQAHSTEGGRCERLVAQEDALQGHGVDTNYDTVTNTIVSIAIMEPGSVFNLLMKSGEDGAPGAEVISAGNGTVKCVDNVTSANLIDQVIGRIDASEAAFTTLAANTLKAIRIV
jgi:hypothetical protein